MPEASFEQVAKLFDPNNPATENILHYIKIDSKQKRPDGHPLMVLGIKDKDLPELVYRILQMKRYPVVDKKLKLVLGLTFGEHDFIIASLEGYHRHNDGYRSKIDAYEAYRSYLDKGRGYYISSMHQGKIVVGVKYTQDKFDRDLFNQKKQEHEY